MPVDFDMRTPVLLQHLQALFDLPPSICKHDICYNGKSLGNSGFQFLKVIISSSKNLGLDKNPKDEVQWGYVWCAWGRWCLFVPFRKFLIPSGQDINPNEKQSQIV